MTLWGLCAGFVQALCGGAGFVSEFGVVRVGRHSKWRKLSLLAGIHDAGMVHPYVFCSRKLLQKKEKLIWDFGQHLDNLSF